MDSLALGIILVLVVFASFHLLKSNPRRRTKLPPGPYPFPIIGNILQLGQNPHRSLANLSKTYGPLMSLHLGSIYTVVVSSPEIAQQVLQEHDRALSSRTVVVAAEAHDYHKNSMGFLPIGNKWRKARKICREHMFSTHRLDESQGLRREKLRKLCDYVRECSTIGRVVNVGEVAFITALNLMTATLFSVDFANFDSSDVAQDLKGTVEGVMKVLGAPNLADFFPILKPIDPQGIKRQSEFYLGKLLDMFEDIINRRLQSRGTSMGSAPKKQDLLETLLDLMEDSEYNSSINDIKYLFLDLFLGTSDTTPSTVEWAMTELLLNPEKMAKAKKELRTVIGENKQVEESDISRLPYLLALIKETLRLHPPGTLLIPHKADYEVVINGYTIPKNAQILVNIWATGRDSSVWPNPSLFEPERFLTSKIDFKGQDFMLIPFGSGRRICPGLPLADRMMHLMVASLIHNFDWKLEPGVKPEEVDTTDKFGIAALKAVPLMAMPIKV